MCIVASHDQPVQGSVAALDKRSHDNRKEKSRDAARERRAKEFEYFQELEDLLPTATGPSETHKGSVDKTSLIRLTVAYLKSRDIIENGLNIPQIKEETKDVPQVDLLSCLDGFTLVLGPDGDVIFVSKNIYKYVGLGPVELVGQTLADYIHPCDMTELSSLTSPLSSGTKEKSHEVTVRMKCTVTDRGRMINLNQASYKPLRISGMTKHLDPKDHGGICGSVFLGTASTVGPDLAAPPQQGVFCTRHSTDMKFTELDVWLTKVAGYPAPSLVGESFYNLIHTGDIQHVQAAFRNLRDHCLCRTAPYRLLVRGGGYCWIQTRASCSAPQRGSSRGQTVICQHTQLTGVEDTHMILASIQMEEAQESSPESSPPQIDLLQVVQQLLEEKPDVKDKVPEKCLIIEPRIIETKSPSSLPTSVIVSSARPSGSEKTTTAPRPITDQIFGQKSKPLLQEPWKPPKVSTQDLWKPPKASTSGTSGAKPVTANIFSASSQVSSAEPKIPWEALSNSVKGKGLDEERELFGGLFNFSEDFTEEDLLENLAPAFGDDGVVFNKTETSINLESPNNDDLIGSCFVKPVIKDESVIKPSDKEITNLSLKLPVTNPRVETTNNIIDIEEDQVTDFRLEDNEELFASLFNMDQIGDKSAPSTISQDNPFMEYFMVKNSDNSGHEVTSRRTASMGEVKEVMLHPEVDIMWGTPHILEEDGSQEECIRRDHKVGPLEGRNDDQRMTGAPKAGMNLGDKRAHSQDALRKPCKVRVVQKMEDQYMVLIV